MQLPAYEGAAAWFGRVEFVVASGEQRCKRLSRLSYDRNGERKRRRNKVTLWIDAGAIFFANVG